MKAARLHAYHQPLKIDQIAEPKITGPLDVVVRIGAAGLCRTDLHIWEGQWAEISQIELPYVPGHENAGWVHEIGPGVTNVEVGDTVIVHPLITCGLCRACRAGNDMHCENGAFPGETAGDLGALRALFQRKALLARQSRLRSEAATTLGELAGPDAERCRALRQALGIDASDDAPAFVTGDGSPVDPSDVRFWRMASLTALSLEVNGGMCRDLLKTRYGEEVAA